MIENVSCIFLCLVLQKMQVNRKCHILNKLPQINFTPQMFFFFFFFAHFQGYNKTHENEWFFQKNISIKWVIFQSTSSDEPNRVLVLFFSPFILFLSVILFTILLMCYKARWVFFTIILQLKSFKLKIHKSS